METILNKEAPITAMYDRNIVPLPNRLRGFFSLASLSVRLAHIPTAARRSTSPLLVGQPCKDKPTQPLFQNPEGIKINIPFDTWKNYRFVGRPKADGRASSPRYGRDDKARVGFLLTDKAQSFNYLYYL